MSRVNGLLGAAFVVGLGIANGIYIFKQPLLEKKLEKIHESNNPTVIAQPATGATPEEGVASIHHESTPQLTNSTWDAWKIWGTNTSTPLADRNQRQ